jgi:catechol 2,3-dioxygenase-like lactoylglutathione lyase family enzyme
MYVSNLARSTEFWGWFLPELGYVLFQEWDAGRRWRLYDTYLVFVQALDRHADVPYHRGRVGLNHLAFWAQSQDQVDALTEQVCARGLRVLYEDRHPFAGGPGHYALYFEDPDRIKVEVIAP